MNSFFNSSLAAALVALIPAIQLLWRGRGLIRSADDPALPERLMAEQRPDSIASAVTVGVLIVAWPNQFGWTLSLWFVSRLAAAYPIRKRLYGETWSFGTYLSFHIRLAVAMFGFWMLLSWTPSLVSSSTKYEWIVGAFLAAVLVAWNRWYVDIVRWLARATPVDDLSLVSQVDRMARECGLVVMPRLEQVDLHGGVYANAVALPSLRRSAVVLTGTLLERFDHAEVVAVCAHEMAHLEHYHPRLLRLNLINHGLIVTGALLAPFLRLVAPSVTSVGTVLWAGGLIATLIVRARQRQSQETASDLRAIALTGDPEALVRALTKLHVIARLPRRWETQFERQATHPSLARRIQAIRTASGRAFTRLEAPVTFAGRNLGSSIIFHEDRLIWNEHDSASYAVRYEHLTELRVHASRFAEPRLVAVDKTSRRWEIALLDADVVAVQGVLDIVDTRLGSAAAPLSVRPALARLMAFLVAVISWATTSVAPILVAALVIVRPAASLTAAAGTAALAAAGLVLRDRLALEDYGDLWIPAALVVYGLVLLGIALANREKKNPVVVRRFVAALAICTLAALGTAVLTGVDPLTLHRVLREWPATTILPLALSTALIFNRSRPAIYASAVAALIGLSAAFLGSIAFLDLFGSDPLLVSAAPARITTISDQPMKEFFVPFEVTEMRLSFSGRYVVFVSEDENEEHIFHFGAAGGALTSRMADDALFVSDNQVLFLTENRDGVDLGLWTADGGEMVWQRRFQDVHSTRLLFDPNEHRWQLLGSRRDGTLVCLQGDPEGPEVDEQRWVSGRNRGQGASALARFGPDLLLLRTRYDRGFNRGSWWQWMSLIEPEPWSESRFSTLSAQHSTGRLMSHLDLSCEGRVNGMPACIAFDGTRTRFVAIDGAAAPSGLAMVPGHFIPYGWASDGWMAGWWHGAAAVMRLQSAELLRIDAVNGDGPDQLNAGNQTLGAVTSVDNGSRIRLYAIP